MMGEFAISARNIIKSYNHDFTLNVPQFDAKYGTIYGFYGPNGSGKTTFMKILSLILSPDSGKIYINNEEVSQKGIDLRRKLSFLFQDVKLLNRNVKGNLAYPLKIRKLKINLQQIKDTLDMLSLPAEQFLYKKPNELSGGEKKRVSLAQKLIFNPDIIFLDEPTANVDVKSIKIISDVIRNLKSQNKCIFISSHDYEWLFEVCDEVYFINKGILTGKRLENNFGRGFKSFQDGLCVKKIGSTNVFASLPPQHIGDIERAGCYIEPRDVLISTEEPQYISAQNIIKMTVESISVLDKNVMVILINNCLEMKSTITKKALADLDLYKGKEVYAIFKATSVKWYE